MDPNIFGADAEQNIVACYQLNEKKIRVYRKIEGKISFEDREFFPFFFITNVSLLDNYEKQILKKKLNGNGFYKYLCVFQNWDEMKDAYNFVFDNYRKNHPSQEKDFNDINLKSDPVAQYLMEYGKTLFKGMNFSELSRISMDITLKPGSKEIESIVLADSSGWKKIIDDSGKAESKKIEEFIKVIIEKDPDVIEGYNLYSNILEVLLKKSAEHNIALNIGRDGLPVTKQSRFSRFDFDMEKHKVIIPGRHFVDVLDLVTHFEYIKKTPDINSLEKLAALLEVKDEISSKEEAAVYKNCILSGKICDRLLPEMFYMNRIISYNLGRLLKLNHPQKIDSILYREYLKQRYAIPLPGKSDPSLSGVNEIYYTGELGPIISCSIENLYQNSILQSEIVLNEDPLNFVKGSLKKIIESSKIKESGAEVTENCEPELLSALKNLSSGYFHYLNNPWVSFNSRSLVADAVRIARETIEKIIKYVSFSGGIPVQIDHDEIIFVPPRDVINEELEQNFILMLSKKVPEIDKLFFRFRARRVLSYRKKNLAFLLYNNKIILRSNLLLSRNVEKFGRKFLLQCIDLLLNNRIDEIHKLYNAYYHNIIERKMDVLDFMRTEVIKESLSEYAEAVKNESRNKIPYYQLAVASGKDFKPNDKISYYYITDEAAAKRMNVDIETTQRMQNLTEGILDAKINPREIYDGCENLKLAAEWNKNFRDENAEHYVKRLNDIAEKLQIFFTPEDFNNIFSPDDLFSYPLDKVKIRTAKVEQSDKSGVQ